MDLNYLYHRHQVSLMRASSAANEPARLAHAALAKLYLREIRKARGTVRASLHAC